MKRILITLFMLLFGMAGYAADNMLHSIVLEGTEDGYNVVLKTDSEPTVKKVIKGNNNLVLNVKDISTSTSVSAVYKSTSDVSGLVVENISNNELNIYIQAKDIAKATIMSENANGELVILSERFPVEKVVWTFAVIGILFMLIKSAKAITEYENSLVIKKDIKDREIELYRKFQRELDSMPKINNKINSAYATNIMPRSRRNYKELARR